MSHIVARNAELSKLQNLLNSPKAEFIALYGRRRVGKTFLIRQFFQNKGIYFEVTGIKNSPTSMQLRKFHDVFIHTFSIKNLALPKDWHEALLHLKNVLVQIPKKQKIILFFDELPWLAKPKSKLLQEIDYYWNRYFSSQEIGRASCRERVCQYV